MLAVNRFRTPGRSIRRQARSGNARWLVMQNCSATLVSGTEPNNGFTDDNPIQAF
jgi:hypothetical protein